MERTRELDIHYKGSYWCEDCSVYTGQLSIHIGHSLIHLISTDDLPVPFVGQDWANYIEQVKQLKTSAEEMFGWLSNNPPTSTGHEGPCGPQANCDTDCMEHAVYIEQYHRWRKLLLQLGGKNEKMHIDERKST